ncbi:hypothetical protein SE17_07175 [Kouleothrix aurantiaca]|jgi:hypothetical protein|uniref:Uncharacterized protein n=1 Tax=Kouleothrix aurantiaca TaxID=186479 RepID=A0A0P9FB07_9CHLR|nr:hypothetical protein SE17_07175 [Kouleothrix aurantiaca]
MASSSCLQRLRLTWEIRLGCRAGTDVDPQLFVYGLAQEIQSRLKTEGYELGRADRDARLAIGTLSHAERQPPDTVPDEQVVAHTVDADGGRFSQICQSRLPKKIRPLCPPPGATTRTSSAPLPQRRPACP